MALELSQIDEYDTFKDLGRGAKAPAGYKKITVHVVLLSKKMEDIRLDLLQEDI